MLTFFTVFQEDGNFVKTCVNNHVFTSEKIMSLSRSYCKFPPSQTASRSVFPNCRSIPAGRCMTYTALPHDICTPRPPFTLTKNPAKQQCLHTLSSGLFEGIGHIAMWPSHCGTAVHMTDGRGLAITMLQPLSTVPQIVREHPRSPSRLVYTTYKP